VGPVAHGGHCVARLPEEVPEVGGTVVFVRHALPGEEVVLRVTEGEVGDRFLRGDVVEVVRASPDRVPPPCSYARPGLCGGCDFQHVALPAQRRLKAAVVAEQLRRLAGIDVPVEVEAVPGDDAGLRWRTRMRFHQTPEGGLGLRAHRSRRVVPVDDCLIQAPGARVVVNDVQSSAPAPGDPVESSQPVREPVSGRSQGRSSTTGTDVEEVRGRSFEVAADGFWQVHVGAPEALLAAVLEAAEVRPGDRVLDLYSGVGLFSAFLAEGVGERGHVLAVEGDRRASELAAVNLAAYPWAEPVTGPVDRVVAERGAVADVVVLDPPRTGARRPVVEAVAATGAPRVVHVACDPAAFARDVALLAEHGYRLDGLRAFDLFPMTHHVEVVGRLTRVP
jgi:tRNA/tmRNA/rRNA uracil-C5-methylase (TrmA/RlmC/RlmD family)